jgi:hypothetical protein
MRRDSLSARTRRWGRRPRRWKSPAAVVASFVMSQVHTWFGAVAVSEGFVYTYAIAAPTGTHVPLISDNYFCRRSR